jgi:hypothetical protein
VKTLTLIAVVIVIGFSSSLWAEGGEVIFSIGMPHNMALMVLQAMCSQNRQSHNQKPFADTAVSCCVFTIDTQVVSSYILIIQKQVLIKKSNPTQSGRHATHERHDYDYRTLLQRRKTFKP